MQVSGQFRQKNRGVRRGIFATLQTGGLPSHPSSKPASLNHSRSRSTANQSLQKVACLSAALSRPVRWSEPQAPSSPARKIRTKTCREKSCWPENVRFHASWPPPSAWPSACRSPHAAQFPLAKSPWPLGSSRGIASSLLSANRTLHTPRTKSSPFIGTKSHIRDFTDFLAEIRAPAFLYRLRGHSRPEFDDDCRPCCAAGKYAGDKYGNI